MSSTSAEGLLPSEGLFSHVSHCLSTSANVYLPIWSLSALILFLTLFLSLSHLHRLSSSPLSPRQQLYTTICAAPVVLSSCSAASLIAPRPALLFSLLQQQYEAFALSAFGSLLFMLLALGGTAGQRGEESMSQRVLRQLAAHGPRRHFATPPLCCLCTPCWPSFDLRATHLLLIYRLLQQFVVATPVLAIVGMWAALALPTAEAAAVRQGCMVLKKLSTLAALWALFGLYQASHDVLRQWNTTRKFIALKAILVLELVQDHLIALIVQAGSPEPFVDAAATGGQLPSAPNDGSLMAPGATPGGVNISAAWHFPWAAGIAGGIGHGRASGECLQGEEVVRFWDNFVFLCECLLMAELMRRAFPAEELESRFADEREGLLIELELLHHFSEESKGERSSHTGAKRPAGGLALPNARWWEGRVPRRASPPHPPPVSTSRTAPSRLQEPSPTALQRGRSVATALPFSAHARDVANRSAQSDFDAAVFGGSSRRTSSNMRVADLLL